jgi:hypothetical protein
MCSVADQVAFNKSDHPLCISVDSNRRATSARREGPYFSAIKRNGSEPSRRRSASNGSENPPAGARSRRRERDFPETRPGYGGLPRNPTIPWSYTVWKWLFKLGAFALFGGLGVLLHYVTVGPRRPQPEPPEKEGTNGNGD